MLNGVGKADMKAPTRRVVGSTEARHLDYVHKRRLGEILATNESWKQFMANIKTPNDPHLPRFSSDDIQ